MYGIEGNQRNGVELSVGKESCRSLNGPNGSSLGLDLGGLHLQQGHGGLLHGLRTHLGNEAIYEGVDGAISNLLGGEQLMDRG